MLISLLVSQEKSMELISSPEELQVEKELQQPNYQNTGESSQAIATTERNHSYLLKQKLEHQQ